MGFDEARFMATWRNRIPARCACNEIDKPLGAAIFLSIKTNLCLHVASLGAITSCIADSLIKTSTEMMKITTTFQFQKFMRCKDTTDCAVGALVLVVSVVLRRVGDDGGSAGNGVRGSAGSDDDGGGGGVDAVFARNGGLIWYW